ncbi:MAG: hypothetical protein JXQ90_15045 [Cyclobacteriaceae bacterium]
MHRNILSLIALFTVLAVSAQMSDELRHFKQEGNSLTWQKSFPSVLTVAEMKAKVEEMDLFVSVNASGDKVSGEAKPIEANYLGLGFGEKDTEKYLIEKDLFGALSYEFQEGKYQVTLKDVKLIQRYDTRKVSRGSIMRLIEVAFNTKKGDWDPSFATSGSAKVVNQTFLKKFEIKGGDF